MVVVRQQRVLDRHTAILLCVLGLASCRRAAEPPKPPLVASIAGALSVDGLRATVRVVRDTWGVPHIYASSQDDLFIAQGFVQAQDRLFQMDLWRRSGQGRLSEVLGPNFIERDAMTRRIQDVGDPAAEWASYGPDAKTIADAFVRGVNAWVALARERPPEEFVLAGWKPELWATDDLLNRTDAFTSSGDALDEVFRARLVATVGAARARLLLPGQEIEARSAFEAAAVPDLVSEAIRRVGTPPFFLGLAAPVTEGTVRVPTYAQGASAGKQPDRDPARTLDNPSRRYFVHLNAPGWNAIGATAPWLPGVAEGHNHRMAWTMAPIPADTQDVYVERLNPLNPRQVEDAGGWVDIETSKGFITVRGRKTPVDFTTETTRHGVIVASDVERHLAFAVRWAGSEPGTVAALAAPALDRALSAAELQSALARWKMPAMKFTYVDAGGARGEQTAALVPGRGWSGTMPVPGWTGSSEWSGWPAATAAATAASASQMILEYVRRHPDRGDALLRTLSAPAAAADSLKAQRGALVDALAEALRERALPASGSLLFAHPLAVTEAARRRFNLSVPVPSAKALDPLAMTFDVSDWDRSTAIDAPGQSGSPDSPHFADLAKLWSQGETFPLVFSEKAVQARAAATLTLTPR